MSCENSKKAGYLSALQKFYDHFDKETHKNREEMAETESSNSHFFRLAGRADVLMNLLTKTGDWIGEEP